MGFGPGMQACFNLKQKPHDNLIDAGKFMMKTFNKQGMKGGSLSLTEAIWENPTANTVPGGERPGPFPSIRKKTRASALAASIKHCAGVLAKTLRQDNEMRGIYTKQK